MTRSEDLYRLFDRAPIGMYRSTEDGTFTYVNTTLARMLDHTVESLLAVNLNREIYVDPTARARLIKTYGAIGVIDGVRVEWKTRLGRRLTVQLHGHIVRAEGQPPSFDASVLDVSSIETAARALQDQRDEVERTARTLDLVVHQMPAMYWLVDHDLRILRTGGAIEDVLGYAPDRWLGTTLDAVLSVEPGTNDPLGAHRRALAGETVRYMSVYLDKQLSSTVAPYVLDGKIAGAIGTAVDVTAFRVLEQRMIDAQRAESLGVLAGGLAHDFNNLLVAILGNAELGLREVAAGAPGRAALEDIRTAGLRAAELTDQLLAYAGRRSVVPARVAPAPVVAELLRLLAPSIPPHVATRVDIPAELAVRGDPPQLRQVLLNLIANAREALGDRPGTIAIRAAARRHDGAAHPDDVITAPTGDYVALEVADDGPGVDPDLRRRMFEPFFTTKPTGHGLGLAAVLGIVRAHGGGLRVASTPGAGTRMIVLWPLGAAAEEVAPPAAPHTVLVIDDEGLVRDVVARMIQDLGYTAVTAPDGQTGLDILDRREVDAVLVDLTMPRMDGAEVVASIRRRRPTLPIVLCSGFDRDRKGPVHADAYLPKPFRIESLEQTLARLLRAAHPGQEV